MDKIYINVEKKTRMISLTKTKIGNDLENLQQELVFKFTDEFVNGSARLEYKIDSDRYHIPMTKDGESYIVPIKNIITKEGKIEMQLVITQVAQDEEIPVFKSNVFYMYCDRSINAQEEAPDDYEYWLDVIEEKLAEVDEALDELDNVDIDASKIGNTATVSITNKEGITKSVEIYDGQTGAVGPEGPKGDKGDKGDTGSQGPQGVAGEDAKINGVNTLSIEAGTNISIDQQGDTLTINATGGSGGSSDYPDLTNKPKINNVELNGNKTSSDLGLQPAGNYALISDIPDVSDFITNTVDDLVNYYKKSETFTKQEVNDLISAITTLDIQVVQTLPTEDISTTTIYLVPKQTAGTSDVYDEYIYVSNAWEHIGNTDIDLSDYVTTSQLNTALSSYTTTTDLTTLLSGKQNTIDSTHKLQSDLVDDTNQTNLFVTSTEKTTWNNKLDQSDLANYVTNTDYAGPTVGGVVIVKNGDHGITVDEGVLKGTVRTYAQYSDMSSKGIVCKGTLENVITGKGLVSSSDLSTVATTGSYNDLSGTPTNVSSFTNDAGYLTTQDISGKEDRTNKVTSLSSSSTDTQYPSAKCVYDMIGDVESILIRLTTGGGVS